MTGRAPAERPTLSSQGWPPPWRQRRAVRAGTEDRFGAAWRVDGEQLRHGGPIAEPLDARYVLERTTGVAGFFGASSMERLPTEIAITDRVREFKAVAI
jgi:hypothetical protein